MKKEMIIPKHVAIILDGNRRWAKHKGIAKYLGHKAGVDNMVNIIKYASDIGIKYLSLYCFSTENNKRDKDEIDYLFSLPETYLNKYLPSLIKDNIKVVFSGDISILPKNSYEACIKTLKETSKLDGLTLNLCFNYGSHDEIIKAIKDINNDLKGGIINIEDINESLVESYLYTKGMPMVDLLIRPGKEKRLSNFLLWQMSYAELYFDNKYWPDFSKKSLDKAIVDFNSRNRRFGGK